MCDGQKWGFFYRFECEKLILVGDPKQLPPTIQGSESAHSNGLEQTLFDRLCLMVCLAIYPEKDIPPMMLTLLCDRTLLS